MATIKGLTIEIGGETTGLSKALNDVNKISRNLSKELGQIERQLKFDPKNTTLLAQKQKVLGDQIATTRDKLAKLKDAEKQVQEQFERGEVSEEQYRALQREIVATESKLKHYESQLKEVNREKNIFSQRIEDASKKLKGIGSKMQDVGKQLSMKVTAPIAAFGGVAAKSAIDFESAFAGVRKTVDATDAELSELGKGIRDMAKEIPAAATEIAGVAEAAGQLGIETPNILAFTRTMIDLGEATNLTAEEAASSLAKFANITQMSQNDFDRLGSVIVALGNNLATTEADIVSMGQRLAGAGAQIGLTEAEIMSFAGALSSVGIEAEAGGSAFSKVMADMQLAVETGSERLNAFAQVAGMSGDEFKKAFQEDASGAIIAFIKGLGDAEKQGSSAIKILDDMGIKEVRLRDALLRASGASDVFTESINLGTKAWEENVALTNEADQRYETSESKIAILKNTLNDLAITFGEHIVPVITDLAEKLKTLVEWFGNLSPETQKTILVIAGLAAAIGPLLLIMGTLAGSIGNIISLGGTLVKNWDKIKSVGSLLSAGLKSTVGFIFSPAGAIMLGIAAVIAIGVLLYKNWDTIKEKAGQLKDFVTAKFDELKQKVSDAWNNIRDSISKSINSAKEKVASIVEGIRDKISSTFDSVKSKVTNIWNNIKTAISNPINAAKNTVSSVVGGIRDKISSTFNSVKSKVSSTWSGIKTAISNPINAARDAVKSAIDRIKGFFNFSFKWPKLPLPKFSITPQGWKIGDLLKGSIPKLGISWNAEGGIFRKPTVIPTMAGLQGFAEPRTGGEAVVPLNKLSGIMADAMQKAGGAGGDIIIQQMSVREEADIRKVARELHNLQQTSARARGLSYGINI